MRILTFPSLSRARASAAFHGHADGPGAARPVPLEGQALRPAAPRHRRPAARTSPRARCAREGASYGRFALLHFPLYIIAPHHPPPTVATIFITPSPSSAWRRAACARRSKRPGTRRPTSRSAGRSSSSTRWALPPATLSLVSLWLLRAGLPFLLLLILVFSPWPPTLTCPLPLAAPCPPLPSHFGVAGHRRQP